jgi:hypothetical protein
VVQPGGSDVKAAMMHAPNPAPRQKPGRKVNATTIMAAILALVALGATGLFISEHMRMAGHWERERDRAEEAKAQLDSIKFDARGNVPPDQRSKFDRAMLDLKLSTDGMRTFNESKGRALPYIGGSVAACLLFLVIAVRSTKQA